jgi:peptidoglycan/LPS O-acetylase OafA/YrhL
VRADVHSPSRLASLDALRGIAALAVVCFHYTTNLRLNYPEFRPSFELPHGHFGVELFFVVSGFVIFMSLARAKSVADFAVSRFARLFPAYWAAIFLTCATLATGGLADRSIGTADTLLNVTMLQEFFGRPHADGVYWTLSRELVFYLLMGSLLAWKRMHQNHALMALLLVVQALLSVWVRMAHPDVRNDETASLLLFPYIHLFAAGISLYGLHRNLDSRPDRLLLLGAITCEMLLPRPEGGNLGHLIVLASIAAVGLAAVGRMQWLAQRPLLWLGSISYALYLIHQNIGYWLIHRLTAHGVSLGQATACALLISLALAHLLRSRVEEPVQRAIKQWWKRRTANAAEN